MHFGEPHAEERKSHESQLLACSSISFMFWGLFNRCDIPPSPRSSVSCVRHISSAAPNSRVNKTAAGNDVRWLGSSSSSFFPFLLFRTLSLSPSPLRAVPLGPSQSYRSFFFSAASVSSASPGAGAPSSSHSPLSHCMIHGRTELYNLGLGIGLEVGAWGREGEGSPLARPSIGRT